MEAHFDCPTLIELLRRRSASEPQRTAYSFLADGDETEAQLTYGELDRRARAVAAHLQSLGARGERALLLYPPGLDYVAAFFGCLYAEVVAVPAYPPRLNRNLARLQAMASDAAAAFALTTSPVLSRMQASSAVASSDASSNASAGSASSNASAGSASSNSAAADASSSVARELSQMRWLATDEIASDVAGEWRAPSTRGEQLAYLQYTSGSTSAPKGVMVTHANVLHNSAYIHRGFEHTPDSLSLTWLPHFHDMGLLDGIIQPLYGGFPAILMSPTAFLQRPLRWLETITRRRVTHTGGPNFAYELCVRRLSEEQRDALDLSSWSVAYNGAEPVRYETLRRFAEVFAPCGFRWQAFYPAYGLAEATLKVSGGKRADAPVLCTVQTQALEQNRVVVLPDSARDEAKETHASARAENERDEHGHDAHAPDEHRRDEREPDERQSAARVLVGSGQVTLDTEVVIVHPETLTPCAPEEVGEIWVAGAGVALGYWNRPEETERTFKARLAGDGARTYLRTGDLGFMRGGELFVTGRLKDLIIIRGRNHYPQDIELAVERSHAALRAGGGAAFAVESGGAERLVVVQEVEQRHEKNWQPVIEAMRERVAEEFEAQLFAVLLVKPGHLPKTSSGKTQRGAAREKFLRREFDALAEWRAPEGLADENGDAALARAADSLVSLEAGELNAAQLEQWLRTLLASQLGIDPSGVDTSHAITRYGLDSLAAIELMHSVETRLGVRLPMTSFLVSPSIAQLAQQILDVHAATKTHSLAATTKTDDAFAATTANSSDEHPLSHSQQALWFLHQLAPESAAYNIAAAVRIHETLDASALERAFQTLARRHPSLRTSFHHAPDAPVQRIHAERPVSFRLEDASAWDEAALDARLGDESHAAFDLEHDALLRVRLFRRSEREHVMLLVAHHLVVDFWSLAVLMHELGQLYRAETTGEPAQLAPHALEYTDYVRAEAGMLDGAEGARLLSFWRRQLSDDPPALDLPTDRPRPPVQTYRGASLPLRLDADLTARLKTLSQTHDATLYMTLLAAFEALLYRYTGQEDFTVGSPTSGRTSAQFAESVGYFVNPVVLRAQPRGELTFEQFLAQVRRGVLDAFEHQDYPFALLVKQLQPVRDPARSPLFQVMFALHRAHLLQEEGLSAFALGEAGARMRLGGLQLESVRLEQRHAQFDLSLTLAEVGGELAASFEYNTDLFDASTIRRMQQHFRTLLEAITAQPSAQLALLPMLTPGERRRLLVDWNSTRDEAVGTSDEPRSMSDESDARTVSVARETSEARQVYESQRCIHELFAEQAARAPGKVAVQSGEERLTYGELNARANELAAYLRARGVGADAIVGICIERSVEMLVALLGVLKAGAAYLPLDPAYPPERQAFMLEDAGVELLLTSERLAPRLKHLTAHGEGSTRAEDSTQAEDAKRGVASLLRLDADWPLVARAAENADATPATPATFDARNLAYVIYTSGSTGRPKGVLVEHASLANYVEAARRAYLLTPDDRVLQFASISFDASAEEIYTTLASGATLVLSRRDDAGHGSSLLEECRAQRLTLLSLPTAYWHELTATAAPAEWAQAEDLRLVVIGGERALAERLSTWRAGAGRHVRLMNTYGPTEATIVATMCDLSGGEAKPGAASAATAAQTATATASGARAAQAETETSRAEAETSQREVPIGRPIRNTRAYILDRAAQPVPVGVAGELHLGGAGLARGYLNRPDLTAERFVPDFFSGEPGARLYRTGDLARYREDGNIEFLGRVDTQVKVRGFRIELAEIEAVLAEHAAVRDVLVVAREEERGDRRLVAYLVAGAEAETPNASELRAFLKERLPDYMIPSAYLFLNALPLTPNGKVDRKALPAPEGARPELAQAYVAPQTPVERILSRVWADVLRLERVGVRDNFFELGGDSILSIQVIARAGEAGVSISPRQIFEYPTVAGLAAVAAVNGVAQAEQGDATGDAPLTPVQRWFFERDFPAPSHWNMALMLETRRRLDASLLSRALARLVEHHDALRARFTRDEAGWRQFIAPHIDASEAHGETATGDATREAVDASDEDALLRVVDLSGIGSWAERRASRERIAEETQRRLDLERGRLVRAVLFESGEGRVQRLLLVVHHLVVDGVSWRVLLEDLARLYKSLERERDGDARALRAKTTSFKHWAERLSDYAKRAELRGELDYWRAQHAGGTKPLPRDFAGGANREASARTLTKTLEREETRSLLQEVPPVYHTQINDVLLTALVKAFARWTGERELLVDLEGHGREHLFEEVELARTVGWFTITYPVLLESRSGGARGDTLKDVKERLRRVPRNGIGYGLLRHLNDDAETCALLRLLPRAEVSFNYLGQLDQMLEDEALFRFATEPGGQTRDPAAPREHLIEVNAQVSGGQLRLEWTYSAEFHARETIDRLAAEFMRALRVTIAHCLSHGAGGHTPSDFPLARLDQSRLDELLQRIGAPVADIYPLSPMQEGMLFHSLYAPEANIYTGQLGFRLHGDLDAAAFTAAWQRLVARHDILRTGFFWENLEAPLQVVFESAQVHIDVQDWRALSKTEQQERLENFLADERAHGFRLEAPPLMRLALLRMEDDCQQFVWTPHHMLLDGWSSSLLLTELFALYDALRRGDEPRIERTRPYRDFVAWLGRQETARAENFWREYLQGFNAPTPLVLERANSTETSTSEANAETTEAQADNSHELPALPQLNATREPRKVETRLSAELTARLQHLARVNQLTLSTIVQGAWALVLSRDSREREVLFGATVSGRPASLAGVDRSVGIFINTQPVRVRVRAEASALAWLKELQAEQVSLREFEHSPLVQVQGWSDVPRGQEMFESLLVFENYPVDPSLLQQSAGLRIGEVRSHDQTNYPLTVIALPGRELHLQMLYDAARFADASVERTLGHLHTLLSEIARAPEQPLSQLSYLTADERRQLLVEWNDTRRDYPRTPCLHQLFEAQVARTPDAVALVCGARRLTYGELNERANRLAHYLRRLGVRAETRVCLCTTRSVEMLVGMLAVLKAGGAYVPLDPEYPQQRLAFMLEDSGASVLLTEQQFTANLAPGKLEVVLLDAGAEQFADEDTRNPESPEGTERIVTADNLAYVIYTSGSTGRPKGVAIEHRSAVAFSYWARDSFAPRDFEGVLALSSICFDLSIFELFVPLHWGGKVILIESVLKVAEAEAADEITLINTVPSAIAELLRLGSLPASARVVNLAGEPLPARLVRQLYEQPQVERVFNLYGPTEDTTYSTWGLMPRDSREAPSIGRPIHNTRVYLLDEQGQPVPVGVAGELHLGGQGLARGYLNRPDLTAERFVPDFFSGEPGARLYRTGDLARYRADGEIEFLGRMDYQVKVRGYRVELGEIEAVLDQHPGVRETAVTAREDAPGEKRLVAYVVAGDGHELSALELRAYLKERVLGHMIPSAFVMLDAMPLTPNGKIDRKALPAPDQSRPEIEEAYAPPRNAVEEVLTGIWQEVLGVERVGVRDNFFELGGHSLLATRVLSNLRRLFRLELPMHVVFEATTVETLAAALSAHESQPGQVEKIARVLQRISSVSSEEIQAALAEKRRERSKA